MKCFATIFALVLGSFLCHQVDGAGASKCYLCEDTCYNPLQQIDCPSSEDTDYACVSLILGSGDETTETRGCAPVGNATADVCASAEEAAESSVASCYACNTDLCNGGRPLKCYSCVGQCDDPEEVYCPYTDEVGFVCLSLTLNVFGSISMSKQCAVKNDATAGYCEGFEATGLATSCYSCETDLCNLASVNPVSKCYSCDGTCDDPLAEVDCLSIAGAEHVCLSIAATSGNETLETKQCATNAGPAANICQTAWSSSKDNVTLTSCYTCAEDLCNAANLSSSAELLKCYSCSGTCDDPVNEVDCPSIEGLEFACLSLTATSDGETLETRQCVSKGDTAQICDDANAKYNVTKCSTCETDLCNSVDRPGSPSSGPAGQMLSLGARLFYAVFIFSLLMHNNKT